MAMGVKVTKYTIVACLIFFLMVAESASAHPGRTDAYGGHNCYVGSCAGTYHYHNGGYIEDDYYDQGYEFGNNDALDNNYDYITSNATYEGGSDGYDVGFRGESEEYHPDAPDWICDDVTFEFRPNEYEDYISGVNDGFMEGCREIANTSYADAYSSSYSEGYATYEEQIAAEDEYDSISSSSSNSWGWILFIGGIAVIVGWRSWRED